jgi:CubicO group peptidase (beta-lactamase class C family)
MSFDDELAEVLGAACADHGTPGAAVGVMVGDQVHVATHGVASRELGQPVTPATLFQVGSITKTFTSAAVMVLAQEGRLDLDDPVARHLPDLAGTTGLDLEAITIEHLLSHQGGFDGDHLLVEQEGTDLGALATARRMFPPGSGFSYSNAGFSIAGAVLEAVSGQSFEDVVRDRLLAPLGMTRATFRADEAITHPVALPHWVKGDVARVLRGGGWQPGWELAPLDRPAGGLIASAEDLIGWCRFQLTGVDVAGSEILTAASLRRLHTPVVTADRRDDIALDWFVREIDGLTTIGHGGTTAGYHSDLLIVPERRVAFVGLTNATTGSSVHRSVRPWVLERVAAMRDVDPQPDATLDPDRARVEGVYLHPFARLSVAAGSTPGTVEVTSSRRTDTDGWQPPLDPVVTCGFFADDHIVTIDAAGPPRVGRFGFDATGRDAAWLLWGGRRAPRIDPPAAQA